MQFLKFLFFILIALPTVLFGQITVESKVIAATVYDKGVKVTRQANASIPTGESIIEIPYVNRYLDENSLQVNIANDAVKMVDVSFSVEAVEGEAKPSDAIEIWADSVKIIVKEMAWIKNQKQILQGEESIIKSNSTLEVKREFSVSELQNLTRFYRERLLEIRKEIIELDETEKALNSLKNTYDSKIQRERYRETVVGFITLRLISTINTTTNLELTYFTNNGWWRPLYEIRADGLDAPINITYLAGIGQNTGYDWENIPITLSNARPIMDNTMPELEAVYAKSYPLKNKVTYDTVATFDPEAYEEQVQIVSYEEKWSETLKTQTSTQFKLDLLQSVKSGGQNQKVIVRELSVPADYQYFTVPGKSNVAYLVAQISEYGQYNLLSGSANLFFEKTYLGKSNIDSQTTSDTLNLSLGIDYDVVVERNRKTFSAPKFIGNTVKETIDFEIKIRNNKSEAITINVLDQIPVSTEKAIEIKLMEKDGASFEEAAGKLKWQITVPANATETVGFSYQLKHPKDVRVAGKW